MGVRRTFVIAVAVVWAWAAGALGQVDTVGDLGQAQIDGCKVIGPQDLRAAMARDAEIQLAASPSGPLAEFLATVQDRLGEGYADNGFPQAKVQATTDLAGKHLVIHVDEGPRYRAGRVRIDGAVLADGTALQAELTEPRPEQRTPAEIDRDRGTILIPTWTGPINASEAAWISGAPAPLGQGSRDRFDELVTQELFRQGLFWARFVVEPALGTDGTADLVVKIVHEGPKAVLADVQFHGLKTNQPRDVLNFLGLRTGAPINLDVLRGLRAKLWDSGRFLRHDIHADILSTQEGRVWLTLEMAEHPKAPPLVQSLSDDSLEGAAVRAALWLQKAVDGGGTLVMSVDAGRQRFKFVVRNGRGALVTWRQDAAASTEPATRPAATTSSDLGLTAVMLPEKLTLLAAPGSGQFAARANFQIVEVCGCVPNSDLRVGTITILTNTHWVWGIPDTEPPVRLVFLLAPVAFLDMVTLDHSSTAATRQVNVKDGVLTISGHGLVLRADAATGRLIELTGDNGSSRVHMTVEDGALERETAAALATAPAVNDYDWRHPVGSLAGFLAQWLAARRPATGATLAKLVAGRTLDPLESLSILGGRDDAAFVIPNHGSAASALTTLGRHIFVWDGVYAYGSWPWTLGREATLVAMRAGGQAAPELARLMNSGHVGPVGCAVLAAALRQASPATAANVAAIGLKRMSPDHFRDDIAVLLQGDRAGPRVLVNLLQGVADLSDADFASIASEMPADLAGSLGYVRQVARDNPGKPVVGVLLQQSDQWWEKSVKKIVDARLRGYGTP